MPDNQHVVFSSTRAGPQNLYSQLADGSGTAERVTTSATGQYVTSAAPDGKQLVVLQQSPETGNDLALLTLGATQSPAMLVRTPAAEGPAEISPDGRWLAYESDESGQRQIYVRPFPDVNGGRWQISPSGGGRPLWAPNGSELFMKISMTP